PFIAKRAQRGATRSIRPEAIPHARGFCQRCVRSVALRQITDARADVHVRARIDRSQRFFEPRIALERLHARADRELRVVAHLALELIETRLTITRDDPCAVLVEVERR